MSILIDATLSKVMRGVLIIVAMVSLADAVVGQSRKNELEGAREAIEKVLAAHTDNWNRHDMDAWADAVLHDDSDWVNWRGGYWRGKAAIKAGHWAVHRSYYKNSRMTPQRIEDIVFLRPDMVLVHARSEMTGDERSPGQTFQYRKTILFTRQNGVWRIRALHNTRLLDPEPAGTAKQPAEKGQ